MCFMTRVMSGSKIYRHPLRPPHAAGIYQAHLFHFTILFFSHHLIRKKFQDQKYINIKILNANFIHLFYVFMVSQHEWMAYNKPLPLCSTAAAVLMQTTWQANGCMWKPQKYVDGTLNIFCECEGYIHKGSFFPPIWFTIWVLFFIFSVTTI